MDLLSAVWMERSLNQPISALRVDSQGAILAGGWDGALKHWNGAGDVLWSAELPDRITSISLHESSVFVTAGLHIACVDLDSGEVRWSHALEGSADALIVVSNAVYAISSVYDIEHNDFIESAVWKYSIAGELEWIQRMDERPWVILEHEQTPWIGLGRPKCGFSSIARDGTLSHHVTEADSPITCGTIANETLLFGHADGTVSNLEGAAIVKQSQTIESIFTTENGFTAALESGLLIAHDQQGKQLWHSLGEEVSSQTPGFDLNGSQTHWTARKAGLQGRIEVRKIIDGSLVGEAEMGQVTAMAYNSNDRVCVGCEDGRLLVWDAAMVERRIRNTTDSSVLVRKKSALQDKLRALRDR